MSVASRKTMMARDSWIAIGLLLSFAILGWAEPEDDGRRSTAPWVIVLFGDSTTAPRQGVVTYGELLREHLSARGIAARVVNAGVGGDTTVRARRRFASDVLNHDPDVVVVNFGINDAAVDVWKDPPATRSRVSTEDFRQNLLYFISTLRHRGTRVVLVTPNPKRWATKTLALYGRAPYRPDQKEGFNIVLQAYVEVVRDLASQERVTLVDTDRAFRACPDSGVDCVGRLLLDGMHPNTAGNRLIADLLFPQVLPDR